VDQVALAAVVVEKDATEREQSRLLEQPGTAACPH
jgi:hypothetical protein